MSDIDLKTMKYEDYPLRTTDKIRYSDTDRQGHVNNAVFACFLETGRVELLYDPVRPLAAAGCSFVIVSLSMNLISELRWPGTAEIGTGVVKIGNSSISMVQGLYQNENWSQRLKPSSFSPVLKPSGLRLYLKKPEANCLPCCFQNLNKIKATGH